MSGDNNTGAEMRLAVSLFCGGIQLEERLRQKVKEDMSFNYHMFSIGDEKKVRAYRGNLLMLGRHLAGIGGLVCDANIGGRKIW